MKRCIMSNTMMWAYLLQLSNHMWADGDHVGKGWYLPPTPYTPENNTDLSVWDDTVNFLAQHGFNTVVIDVGDGIQFDSHPEISAPDAWSKDFLKAKLDEMRTLGLNPIPKLNFSTRHNTWLKEYGRMISTPKYYQVCADVIREVSEAFGTPELFHLGLDEENKDLPLLTGVMTVRHDDLFWHDTYMLFDECEKNGVRPWTWADRYHNDPEQYAKHMPKSVLQSNWFYGYLRDVPKSDIKKYNWIHTYEQLDALNYEQVPCCSAVEHPYNIHQTVAHGKDALTPALLKGFMVAPWVHTEKKHEFRLKNEALRLYDARRQYFTETL